MIAQIDKKIKRIRSGLAPRLVDLFSGCGGLALGLQSIGYEIIAGLDSDHAAMETWWHNFYPNFAQNLSRFAAADITKTHPKRFFADLRMKGVENDVDVLCGGPPCQPYSRIGIAKLRSLNGYGAHLADLRGDLYEDYLRFVRILVPLAIVLENVPDSVDYGGENIPEQICHRLSHRVYNYEARWTILEAAEYGVPQYRQRVIILAVHRSLGVLPEFPSPTHRCVRLEQKARLRGALGRTADILARRFQKHGGGHYFVAPPAVGSSAIPAHTAEGALSDLPQIFTLSSRNLQRSGCSDVSQLLPYHLPRPLNDFQRRMRAWPGFETMGWVSGNVIRQTLRDFPTFHRMKQGDNYRQAVQIAMDRFNTGRRQEEQRLGRKLTRNEIVKLKKKIVPPYSLDKFDTKWAMLWRDRPSHTVVAHLQYDTYSHIHYDFQQARAISVREAARLQSIPDGFKFFGSIADSFRQIGNAVPPLLAANIGNSLLSMLRGSEPRKTTKRGAAA